MRTLGVLNGYRVKDLLHFMKMHGRHRRRNKLWSGYFQAALKRRSFVMPSPAVIQILPTERCNLSCKMCNQWGGRGYYHSHDNAVGDMPIEELICFLRSIESSDFLLNVHGGEPFHYKGIDELLDYLIETGRDTIFTTNATLLSRHLPKLGRLKNAMYVVSIDGDRDTHDRIRGSGTFQKIMDNLASLKESYIEQSGIMPLLSMNFCVSEYITPSDIAGAYKAAEELGFFNINYGLLWFVTDEAGHEYERQLMEEFQITPSECWKALRCDLSSFDVDGIAQAICKIRNKLTFRLKLPYVSTMPRNARSSEHIRRHFVEHSYSFDRKGCLFPFYFARIHSNGDIIFCQGYRDIIAGNIFRDDFYDIFNSRIAQRFREFCTRDRLSICSKCCGLYLSYAVDKFVERGPIHWQSKGK